MTGNVVTVGYSKIDSFVSRQQAAGNKCRWDGWDILFFYPHPYAVNAAVKPGEPRPVQWDGVWGFETRVSCDSDGLWRIPNRSARPIRDTRR